jgi:hypothetical protein
VAGQLDHTWRKLPVASVGRSRSTGCPDQKASDRMPAVKGMEQAPDLLPAPDISALEFG